MSKDKNNVLSMTKVSTSKKDEVIPEKELNFYDEDGKPDWNKFDIFGNKCIVVPYTTPKKVGSIIVPDSSVHPERRSKVVAAGPDSPVKVNDIVLIGDRDILPLDLGGVMVFWCKPEGIIAVANN